MKDVRFILWLSLFLVGAMITIVVSCVDTSADSASPTTASPTTASSYVIPDYIDDIRSLSLGEVHSITTYFISSDDFATVVLTDGTECYCDQAIARDLRDAIDGANDKEFEIWTNNDNEHEIVCIN